MGATSLPFRGKPMRQDQYMHSFIRMSRSCTAVAACAVLTLVVTVGYRIYTGNWQFFAEDILFMILCAVIACFSIGLILLLRSVDFAEMPNSHVPYEQSIFWKNTATGVMHPHAFRISSLWKQSEWHFLHLLIQLYSAILLSWNHRPLHSSYEIVRTAWI